MIFLEVVKESLCLFSWVYLRLKHPLILLLFVLVENFTAYHMFKSHWSKLAIVTLVSTNFALFFRPGKWELIIYVCLIFIYFTSDKCWRVLLIARWNYLQDRLLAFFKTIIFYLQQLLLHALLLFLNLIQLHFFTPIDQPNYQSGTNACDGEDYRL